MNEMSGLSALGPVLHIPLPSSRNELKDPSRRPTWPIGCFDDDDLAVLLAAYDEAIAFRGPRLSLMQRREIAATIIKHAGSGLRDARRLAIKAIAAV